MASGEGEGSAAGGGGFVWVVFMWASVLAWGRGSRGFLVFDWVFVDWAREGACGQAPMRIAFVMATINHMSWDAIVNHFLEMASDQD